MNHRWFTLFLLTTFFASLTLCGGGARNILLLGFYTGVIPTDPPHSDRHTVNSPLVRMASELRGHVYLLTCQQWQQKSSHLHPASTHLCLDSQVKTPIHQHVMKLCPSWSFAEPASHSATLVQPLCRPTAPLHVVQSPPWQFWGAVILEPFYIYAMLVSCVGWIHLGLMCAVVSTKDVIHYGCGTCNERACRPGGGQFLVSQWKRQWFSPVRSLPDVWQYIPARRPQPESPSAAAPLLEAQPASDTEPLLQTQAASDTAVVLDMQPASEPEPLLASSAQSPQG